MTGSLVASLGAQMLVLAIGWELYERTNSALALGFVGLVQIVPVLLLALVAGHIADQYNRKKIVTASQAVMAASALGLAAMAVVQGPLVAIYGCLLLRGLGAAFSGPASSALIAEVIPEEAYENSASWRSSFGQVASVAGPAIGGFLIAFFHATTINYLLSALGSIIFVVALFLVHAQPIPRPERKRERPTLRSLGEGIAFLRRTPVVLSAITTDLFAVLFGGATALLPIFARDILQVGPEGLGWLEAGPSIGAVCIGLYLAHRPPLRRAGPTFFLVVAGFGLSTIVFGLSRSFWLSLAMLFSLGALDCVSMVIRETLMLARIPDEMRGRVNAIEGVFVSSSNQLGGFESGVTAQLFGPIISVVAGGIGTIVVVAIVAWRSAELRRLTTLREEATATMAITEPADQKSPLEVPSVTGEG
jgi:MFS family permease